MIYFTADLHLGHPNIIQYCRRPFKTIQEHDAALIGNWNATVEPDDVVYFLGDLTLCGIKTMTSYVEQLNGMLCVIPGNHDRRWIRELGSYRPLSASGWKIAILDHIVNLSTRAAGEARPTTLILSHYAMVDWDMSYLGTWHLFGRSHNKYKAKGFSTDVGVDAWNYKPVSLNEIRRLFGKRKLHTISSLQE